MVYSERLKHYRDRNNIKEKKLASILKISKSLYSEYENEIKIMPIKHLNTLCNYLNISFDYILGFNDKPQYTNIKKMDNLNNKIVGQRLKIIRKKYKLTQENLGKIAGCSYGTIAGYEIGRYLISTPTLYKICKKYNISADYLLGKIDNNKNHAS